MVGLVINTLCPINIVALCHAGAPLVLGWASQSVPQSLFFGQVNRLGI